MMLKLTIEMLMSTNVSDVRFPVRCPVCGNEVLTAFRIADVIGALINSRKIRLYAICHDAGWDATDAEMRQLREYVDAARLDSHSVIDDSHLKRAAADPLKPQHITHLTRVAILGELAGALAHELQQPLTAILSNAQAAQLLTAEPQFNVETLREILQDIVSDDKRAGQIIARMRSLLMRGEIQLQRVEIADLLSTVLALAQSTLDERNVQVHSHIEDGVPAVLGDSVELQQVLLNLILNACESMSANAAADRRIEIVIARDSEAGAVRTSVLDRGKGIEDGQLEHIFAPFFTTKASGLGLGLAVCRSILAAHNGRLWATNRPDSGAAFHFTLPVASGDRD
jgi:C4-dicarboxylate-specific signal transduction histidine kinase